MVEDYDPWELLIRWNRGDLSLEDAFRLSLKNQVRFYHHHKLNGRDVIRQQEFIEEIFQTLSEYDARIRILEQKDSDNHQRNGVPMT